jgi:hypothetical protein
MSFFFCSDDACIESFESEEDLITHESIGQHTTRDSHFSANDTAKILLFDKSVITYMIGSLSMGLFNKFQNAW